MIISITIITIVVAFRIQPVSEMLIPSHTAVSFVAIIIALASQVVFTLYTPSVLLSHHHHHPSYSSS